jgi:predicted nucleic acid-binding protein
LFGRQATAKKARASPWHPHPAAASAAQPLFQAGLELHRDRPDKEWSLTDYISCVVMRQRGITQALAFDRQFEQADFEALLRRDQTSRFAERSSPAA